MSKILILNAKGGVGKSTISMQVVVPYLYLRGEKEIVNYYEFDDENEDSKSFINSKLVNSNQIKVRFASLHHKK